MAHIWLRRLCTLFFLYHLTAITVWSLSTELAVREFIRQPFQAYVVRSGIWQGWDMFHSVPAFRRFKPMFIVEWGDGAVERRDPILPGFTKAVDYLRMPKLFVRTSYASGEYSPEATNIFKGFCQALQETGRKAVAVTLEIETAKLNIPLVPGGVIAPTRRDKSKRFVCD